MLVHAGIHAGDMNVSSNGGSTWWYHLARLSSWSCVKRWYCKSVVGNCGCGRPLDTDISGTKGARRCCRLFVYWARIRRVVGDKVVMWYFVRGFLRIGERRVRIGVGA